ncbi:hypothetical protein D9757_010769 [Collybiopsis confluens]|uniref:Uncharacterized protein n=1 Tax=Collybiopsis confluens TaxID=2823264 RepID=A0A8H5H825_9AGAR|nr:hypothetical protein D9757_010769 [Collybiopsis confluens]
MQKNFAPVPLLFVSQNRNPQRIGNSNRLIDKPPPSKKFWATTSSLQPEPGTSTATSFGRTPEIEDDFRAMEDEADRLRRETRARNLDSTLRQNSQTPARPPPQKPSGSRKPRHDTTSASVSLREPYNRQKQAFEGGSHECDQGRVRTRTGARP